MVSMGDRRRLFFDDLNYLAAFVLAAMGADAVRELGLMAIGAF
jgi:hypothetical protein